MLIILGIQVISSKGDLRKMCTIDHAKKVGADAISKTTESISRTYNETSEYASKTINDLSNNNVCKADKDALLGCQRKLREL